MNKFKVFWFLLTALATSMYGCERICTSIQKTLGIKIVDQNDNPVSSVELEIINFRTGKKMCVKATDISRCEDDLGEIAETGNYVVVLSNNISNKDVTDFDTIEVTGTKGTSNFTEQYLVRLTSNGCHPKELIGPQKIVMDVSAN